MSQHSEFNPHPLLQDYVRYETRRQFFKRGASLMGTAALAMLAPNLLLADDKKTAAAKDAKSMLAAIGPHFPPTAKQVIYLHMVGDRRSWICLITNRSSASGSTKICPIPFAWASVSPR